MYLRVSGDLVTEKLLQEIAVMTDCTKVDVNGPAYDKEKGVFRLPMKRLPLGARKMKKGLFISSWTSDKKAKICATDTVCADREKCAAN